MLRHVAFLSREMRLLSEIFEEKINEKSSGKILIPNDDALKIFITIGIGFLGGIMFEQWEEILIQENFYGG
jgi:hypothetical protein